MEECSSPRMISGLLYICFHSNWQINGKTEKEKGIKIYQKPEPKFHPLQRQSGDGGFQGRINKPSDTCYAFWWEQSHLDLHEKKPIIVIYSLTICLRHRVGGVLKMLGLFEFINKDALRNFILSCQSKVRILTLDFFFYLGYLNELLNDCFSLTYYLYYVSQYGGFTKFPGMKFPDLYHSYYSFSALSLLGEPGFRSLCVELGICSDSHGK